MEMEKEVRMEVAPMAKEEDEELDGLVEDDSDRKKRVVFCCGTVKKASGGGGSVIRCCQAENCPADLNEAKQYHWRHRVCEHHSKAQIVVVGGIKQRFCQQCSKFHEVSEFDERKRSCRKRLAGHNERRRKYPAGEANSDGSSRQVEERGRQEEKRNT